MLFLALAALVLLLACINVGNILMVRASARQREMAVRAALGAGRSRLARQLLTESLLLAVLGGVGGVLLGILSSSALSSVNLQTPIPLILNFQFDWNVFVFAFGIALITGCVVGIVPAIRSSRGDLADVLRGNARSVAAGKNRVRSALVVVQVAGSLTLLIVAALFVRSLEKAQRIELGFDQNNLVNLTLDANEAGYTDAQGLELARTLLGRVQALPGVQSASMAFAVPMGYISARVTVEIPGYQLPSKEPAPVTEYNIVAPRYFETLRIPMVRGREFTAADVEKSPYVAVINESMAQKYWPKHDPIGRRFQLKDEIQHMVEVVGVSRNSRARGFSDIIQPYFYVPLSQTYASLQTLQVRTTRPPEITLAELEKLAGTIAPDVPVFGGQTMVQGLNTLNGSLRYQIAAGLAATLGVLGLILALVGLYGVVAYAAAQRTHEIGIRMALGARPGEILRLMAGQALLLVGAGLLLGLGAAFAAGRLLRGFFVGASGTDPVTYAAVTLLLAFIALAACYIPARRATRIDPMVALRGE
jgi:predicted permease